MKTMKTMLIITKVFGKLSVFNLWSVHIKWLCCVEMMTVVIGKTRHCTQCYQHSDEVLTCLIWVDLFIFFKKITRCSCITLKFCSHLPDFSPSFAPCKCEQTLCIHIFFASWLLFYTCLGGDGDHKVTNGSTFCVK